MADIIDYLNCPITNTKIDIGLCQEIQFVVDGAMVEELIDFRLKKEDMKICENCKKRIDPSF